MNRSAVVCVSQLNRYVKAMLDSDSALDGLMVRGEISNFLCHYKSGHMYFTLKDETAAIKTVMFRGQMCIRDRYRWFPNIWPAPLEAVIWMYLPPQ